MPRNAIIGTALAASFLALAACAPPRQGKIECPRIHEYSDTQLDAIQKSINALPQDDALRSAMQDYEDMRDDTRVCQAEAKGE
jgi:hypothetical protein